MNINSHEISVYVDLMMRILATDYKYSVEFLLETISGRFFIETVSRFEMTSKELPDFVGDLLKSITKEYGFVNYSVQVKSGSQTGDGFTSQLFCIIVTEKTGDKKLDLVCKIAPLDKNYRKEFFSDLMFGREALLYRKLMPILAKFQDEKKVPKNEQFVSYPKCYATKIDEQKEQFAIILEDLRPHGFKLWDKATPSPIENVRLAMRELGKFHGLSFAMKDQKPKEFEEFKQVKDVLKMCVQSKSMQKFFNSSFDRAINSLTSEEHKTIMTHIKTNLVAYMEDCVDDSDNSKFNVLCHGDYWNNNMLFWFNDQGVAEEVRVVDWQIIRYVSPATDMLYNLFTSTEKPLRDKEYDNLLDIYHKSLSKMVRSLGSDPDKLFTLENLKDELKKCGNYALIMAPMLVGVSQADSSDISNMEEILDDADGKDTLDLITGLSDKGQLEYERRLAEVFDDIIRLGYYRKVN